MARATWPPTSLSSRPGRAGTAAALCCSPDLAHGWLAPSIEPLACSVCAYALSGSAEPNRILLYNCTLQICQSVPFVSIPAPNAAWTCGLQVRGNFTCSNGEPSNPMCSSDVEVERCRPEQGHACASEVHLLTSINCTVESVQRAPPTPRAPAVLWALPARQAPCP